MEAVWWIPILLSPWLFFIILTGVIVYFAWLRPINVKKDLSDIGFRHLTDGSYQSVEHSKLTLRQLVHLTQKRRNMGSMPPVYPNGWFRLLESVDVPKGQVRHVSALGENFAVFRTEEGEVRVLDAYCPHLGVNMAIGGTVRGNCLECPFHKWQFSGDTGACTKVPYSSGAVPSARVKKWTSHEVNHFIFVWYHAEGEDPSWHIQSRREVDENVWKFQGRTELLAACHIQDFQENAADVGHLNAIHGPNIMAGVDLRHCDRYPFTFLRHMWDANWEPSTDASHISVLNLNGYAKLFDRFKVGHVSAFVQQFGPSYVELDILAPWGPMLLFMTVTPIEPLLLRVVHRMYSPSINAPLCKFVFHVEMLMIERDLQMWNHKKYEMKPHLVKEDGAILRHRRWYHQFYTEHSPLFGSRQSNLDW